MKSGYTIDPLRLLENYHRFVTVPLPANKAFSETLVTYIKRWNQRNKQVAKLDASFAPFTLRPTRDDQNTCVLCSVHFKDIRLRNRYECDRCHRGPICEDCTVLYTDTVGCAACVFSAALAYLDNNLFHQTPEAQVAQVGQIDTTPYDLFQWLATDPAIAREQPSEPMPQLGFEVVTTVETIPLAGLPDLPLWIMQQHLPNYHEADDRIPVIMETEARPGAPLRPPPASNPPPPESRLQRAAAVATAAIAGVVGLWITSRLT